MPTDNLISKIKKQGENLRVTLADSEYQDFRRVSRLGGRIYIKSKDIEPLDYGFLVISTPQGLMTERQAKNKGLGGEVMCEVR